MWAPDAGPSASNPCVAIAGAWGKCCHFFCWEVGAPRPRIDPKNVTKSSPHRLKIDENRTPRHPRDWRDGPRGTLGEHLGDPGPPWETPWEPRPKKVAKRWFADPPRDPPGGAILRQFLEKVEKEARRDRFCRTPGPIRFFRCVQRRIWSTWIGANSNYS